MKHIAIAGLLLCLGASAHAANLLINLTSQVPTYTTDGTWIAPSAGTYAVTNFASSGEFVGDGERQRAASARNRWNFLQVESKDLC